MTVTRHAVHSTTPSESKCHSVANVGIRCCNSAIPVKPMIPARMATIQSDSASLTPLPGVRRYPVAMTPIRMGRTSRIAARDPDSALPMTSAMTNA